MVILISCAKSMSCNENIKVPYTTIPIFQEHATIQAIELSKTSSGELGKMLNINTRLALKNHLRYREFISKEPKAKAAITTYNGTVFQNMNIADFSTEDFQYAQDHIRITSFLYGLLRPLDAIKCYRLEGNIELECNNGKSIFENWRNKITKIFIDFANKNGGIIVYLSSEEMKNLFNWNLVENETHVIYPEFQIQNGNKFKTIVMYTKMCRGQMARFIIKNKINDISDLKDFAWEGFSFSHLKSTEKRFSFTFYL